MIDISMDMEQYDCPFIDTTADHDVAFSAIQWEFDRTARELETRLVVEGDDRTTLESGLDALREHSNMNQFGLLSKREGTAHIRTRIAETDAMGTIRDNDGYITGPFYIEGGSEIWHVGFDGAGVADDALADLERNNEFDVVDRTRQTLPEMSDLIRNAGAAMTLVEGCRDLSNTERRTLEAAVDGGYFRNPRDADLGTLADEFDVSKPAVSKNLRRAERKAMRRVIDALDDLEG